MPLNGVFYASSALIMLALCSYAHMGEKDEFCQKSCRHTGLKPNDNTRKLYVATIAASCSSNKQFGQFLKGRQSTSTSEYQSFQLSVPRESRGLSHISFQYPRDSRGRGHFSFQYPRDLRGLVVLSDFGTLGTREDAVI